MTHPDVGSLNSKDKTILVAPPRPLRLVAVAEGQLQVH